MKKWKGLLEKLGDPVARLEKHLVKRGVISQGYRQEVEQETQREVRDALA